MLTVENIQVFNFEGAFRGLRNPMNSWDKSDSFFKDIFNIGENAQPVHLGEKDLNLAQRMIGAGTDESKFLRQIFISMDITAPLYWWKEFDTYKVGTVANSCSTMHKITSQPITMNDFSFDETEQNNTSLQAVVDYCESLRQQYLETKDKAVWRTLIQVLPSAWNQKRTVTLNYQNARAIYFARRNHKLLEWHILCGIFLQLPYGKELICYEKPRKVNELAEKILSKMGISIQASDNSLKTEEQILSEVESFLKKEV